MVTKPYPVVAKNTKVICLSFQLVCENSCFPNMLFMSTVSSAMLCTRSVYQSMHTGNWWWYVLFVKVVIGKTTPWNDEILKMGFPRNVWAATSPDIHKRKNLMGHVISNGYWCLLLPAIFCPVSPRSTQIPSPSHGEDLTFPVPGGYCKAPIICIGIGGNYNWI